MCVRVCFGHDSPLLQRKSLWLIEPLIHSYLPYPVYYRTSIIILKDFLQLLESEIILVWLYFTEDTEKWYRYIYIELLSIN
jgi:hypothetical protein